MVHVFIVGSKGIPANYGGFETFVEQLTRGKESLKIKYHVSCMNNDERHFEYNDSDCFNVRVPMPGAPGRIMHMGLVLAEIVKWAKSNKDERIIVYILGCRIGPLLIPYSKILHNLNVKIYCNPDGLEWKRDKWNTLAKIFLKYCEKCLVLNSDLVICDSQTIERYILKEYGKKVKETTYIAYGTDVCKSTCDDIKFLEWQFKYRINKSGYYLIVGRFVPENNYEYMISEFMKSNTDKNLIIVTNVEHDRFYKHLLKKTEFDKDERIKFVGTVYNQELLKKIREGAYAYIHGHEVGGTNPSLLEALANTKLNLLLDVGFNREVGRDGVIYWDKQGRSLSECINYVDCLDFKMLNELDNRSKQVVLDNYSSKDICRKYESIFENV